MAVHGKDFTFIWNIKNYTFSFYEPVLHSPSFFVDALDGTEWILILDSYKGKDSICCRIQRKVPGPYHVVLDYELSFLSGDGSVLRSEIFKEKGYTKGYVDENSELCAQKDDILMFNKDLFIPNDTLTLCCRMWNSKEPILEAGRCSAETKIVTEHRTYIGTIEKFSNIDSSCKTLVCIKSSAMKNFFSSMNLCVTADGKLHIEIKPVDYGHRYKCQCKIFIRDVSGNKIKCGQGEFQGTKLQSISLTLPKEHLMENKGYYLPNDVLTLECDVISPTGKEIEKVDEEMISDAPRMNSSSLGNELVIFTADNAVEKINEPEYKFISEGTQTVISISNNTTLFSGGNHTGSFTTLKDDWISLFNHRILCDVEIKTPTETFSAHVAVLSARSPVFKTMFTTDMIEKTNHYVDIPDLDADTVRRMLLFMYSDTLDNLQYESAISLYFAADKYSVVTLRHLCSNFLKQSLQQSNCCDILILAYKHQDQDLKSTIQDFITKESEAVLSSEDWKNLEENHPKLTIEFFRALYLNNRAVYLN